MALPAIHLNEEQCPTWKHLTTTQMIGMERTKCQKCDICSNAHAVSGSAVYVNGREIAMLSSCELSFFMFSNLDVNLYNEDLSCFGIFFLHSFPPRYRSSFLWNQAMLWLSW